MPYYIIIRFIVIGRISYLNLPLITSKLLTIESKGISNSLCAYFPAFCPIRSINSIIVDTASIITKSDTFILSRADYYDSIAIRYSILLYRSK